MSSSEAAAAGLPAPDGKFGRRRNPIFARELLTLLRSRRSFALLGVYLAISIAIMLASWPRETSTLLLQGAVSREVFSIFALGQTLLLALLLPAMLGSCMTTEKEGETIDLLLTTPVSADQIVVGKLLSGLFYFLLLQVASVPVLLLCFVIGGLSSQDVAGLYLHLAVQLILYGLTSVCCSIYFHRTHVAVILSYVFVGIEALVLSLIYGDGLRFMDDESWVASGAFGLAIGGLLYLLARMGARRPFAPVRKSMEEEDVSEIVGLVIRRDQFPDRWIVPERRLVPLLDGVNPVLDKELQSEIYGSGSLFIRLVVQLGLVLSLGAFVWMLSGALRVEGLMNPHPEYIYLCFAIGYILVLGPSIASTTFSHEKEEHTIEALALTLIPRSQIVLGKFLAIARVVGALTLLNSFLFLVAVLFSSHNFSQLVAMAMVVFSTTAFVTALGMHFSLACRSTLSAVITTYFVLFVLFIGPILLETFLTRLLPGVSLDSVAFLSIASPFLACRLPAGGPAAQLGTLFLHGSIYGVATILLLGWMSSRFEKTLQKQAHLT